MKKSTVIMLAGAVTAVMVVREIALRQAFEMMVARKNSRLGEKFLGNKEENKRPYYEDWLETVNVQEVSIISHDGLKLCGHYTYVCTDFAH